MVSYMHRCVNNEPVLSKSKNVREAVGGALVLDPPLSTRLKSDNLGHGERNSLFRATR